MIPIEVKYRIARYFFHRYLPEEVLKEIVDRLLTPCIWIEREDLGFDEVVGSAIKIIDK